MPAIGGPLARVGCAIRRISVAGLGCRRGLSLYHRLIRAAENALLLVVAGPQGAAG